MSHRKNKRQKKEITKFEFEKIMDHRVTEDGVLELFVKWKDFSEADNTWEPYRHFETEAVDRYLATINVKTGKEFRRSIQCQGARLDNRANNDNNDDDDDDDENDDNKDSATVVEQIMDVKKMAKTNELVCMVRCKDFAEPQYIPARLLNTICPQMVIKFYESVISWEK